MEEGLSVLALAVPQVVQGKIITMTWWDILGDLPLAPTGEGPLLPEDHPLSSHELHPQLLCGDLGKGTLQMSGLHKTDY